MALLNDGTGLHGLQFLICDKGLSHLILFRVHLAT
jgi:hypothetical protein